MAFSYDYLSRSIGIDLGSANTLIYMKGKGIILREASVLAIEKRTGKVLAVGESARKMIGRTPEDIILVKPIRRGVVSNFHNTKIMLKHFFAQIFSGHSLFLPLRVVVNVSLQVTEIEKRAVIEAVKQAGAKEVYLVENSIAGALGTNLPIEENSASMIVDIGCGTTEVAVISLGGIVCWNSVRVGGDDLNNAVINYIRKKYNFLIGERTAEDIKIKIGLAPPSFQQNYLEVLGNDLVTRLPRKIDIKFPEIGKILGERISVIRKAIMMTLEETPVSLIPDILENGIILIGGGALLRGFQHLIAEETKMPVLLAENCLDSVALGTGKMLTDMALLKKIS
ncbi:MAG: rod shape-determining protein [Firmicutes bacterium]|nr:rod shape-determining protein [Bacillota bacterium]